MRSLAAALIGVAVTGAPVQHLAQSPAQSSAPKVIEQEPIIGVRTAVQWLPDSIVRTTCPGFVLRDPGPQDVGHDGTPFRSWCGVDTSYVLPDADGTSWMTAVYSRRAEYPPDPAGRPRRRAARDTVRLITTVLYARRGNTPEWNAEWVGTVAGAYVRWLEVEIAPRPDRSLLAGVRYCFNGTGGCWQRFMRRSSARWTPVVEQFWKEFPPIPNGRIGKGPGVSLANLTGSFGVYADSDGNCCPSRELVFDLELRSDSLVLLRHEIRKTPPP